jgi:hypothetical protein
MNFNRLKCSIIYEQIQKRITVSDSENLLEMFVIVVDIIIYIFPYNFMKLLKL